jgi:hypothetical protein
VIALCAEFGGLWAKIYSGNVAREGYNLKIRWNHGGIILLIGNIKWVAE